MGAQAAGSLWGGAASVAGQNKGQKKAQKGNTNAQRELGTPPIFMKGGPWWDALTGPNNLLAQNAVALLQGNSAKELEPAMRASDMAGRNNQQRFASQLARSGLTGSGFGLGGNQAIQNQSDVNRQNILAQLPGIRRENLAALFPYFSRYLGNQEFRAGGLSGLQERRGSMNAAADINRWNTVSSAIGGKGSGNPYEGGGGGGGGKGGGGK